MIERFEPKVVGFLCNWCSYEGADAAGRAHMSCPSNFTPIRVMCSGRIDPQFVFDAFANGADGVLILGCHPGDCHYKDGNHSAMRRNILLKKVLAQFGIEEERMRLDWVSASEGERYARIVSEMVEQVRALGPRPGYAAEMSVVDTFEVETSTAEMSVAEREAVGARYTEYETTIAGLPEGDAAVPMDTEAAMDRGDMLGAAGTRGS